jgi:hypothetical protein
MTEFPLATDLLSSLGLAIRSFITTALCEFWEAQKFAAHFILTCDIVTNNPNPSATCGSWTPVIPVSADG